MGGSQWSSDAFRHYSQSASSKSANDIFTNTGKGIIDSQLSPNGVKIRESRDSVAHPNSIAIQVFLDVTSSMGHIPEILIKEKLGSLMDTLIANGQVDAHVLFGAITDHLSYSNQFPLQVSQYEAGNDELIKWLSAINIEGGGGGQRRESYLLAWYFAAYHTSIDCFEKRNKKGFLFTIGDEGTHTEVSHDYINNLMGKKTTNLNLTPDQISQTYTAEELLAKAREKYHVFHIHVEEGHYPNEPYIMNQWKNLLGENFLICRNYRNLGEIIATTVAVINGIDIQDITSNFDTNTARDVSDTLNNVVEYMQNSDDEIVTL